MTTTVLWKPFTNNADIASVRLRSLLPARLLAARGWRTGIYGPGDTADIVVFQKAYTDEDVRLARRLRDSGVRTIFDLCDNHFHDAPPERVRNLKRMINVANLVSVPTAELAKVIGGDAAIIDDVVEIPRASLPIPRLGSRTLRLVWFGQSGRNSPYAGLKHLGPVLPELAEAGLPMTLSVITESRAEFHAVLRSSPIGVRFRRWRRSTFSSLLRLHDICILPVELNAFTRCKSSNRVALALALGIPVVADRVPSYLEFSDAMMYGDWANSVRTYAADPSLRQRHVEVGRRVVAAKHSSTHIADQWEAALHQALA